MKKMSRTAGGHSAGKESPQSETCSPEEEVQLQIKTAKMKNQKSLPESARVKKLENGGASSTIREVGPGFLQSNLEMPITALKIKMDAFSPSRGDCKLSPAFFYPS